MLAGDGCGVYAAVLSEMVDREVNVGVTFNLLPETLVQHRQIKLVLAQQGQLAACSRAQRVRQAPGPNTFGTRRI